MEAISSPSSVILRRVRHLSVSGLCACLFGCSLQVTPIPSETLDAERVRGPLPSELLLEIDQDIRQLVTAIHRSGTSEVVRHGELYDDYRIEGQRTQREDNLRDRYTGEFYRCTLVLVTIRLNYHRTYYDPESQRVAISNKDVSQRTDRLCTYDESGRELYTPNIASTTVLTP